MSRPLFSRYIGIDYSGAATPRTGLSGLRVYMAMGSQPAREVLPSKLHTRRWSRSAIASWLIALLSDREPTIVAIDHGFSFPMAYFEQYQLPADWSAFLNDFHAHWPTDLADVSVESVRRGKLGDGCARRGNARWRRITDIRAAAKSVFHFDVPGSVAKSTHAGLPWLRFLRLQSDVPLHFWPFDGWYIPGARSVIAEGYPSLFNKAYPQHDRSPDQQDAFALATWLRDSDIAGRLAGYFRPSLSDSERATAAFEGWILGVA